MIRPPCSAATRLDFLSLLEANGDVTPETTQMCAIYNSSVNGIQTPANWCRTYL